MIAQIINSGIQPHQGTHFVKKIDSYGGDGSQVAQDNIESGFKGIYCF